MNNMRPVLAHKTILFISTEPFGKMFLSKHHYAIELARLGNQVYFLIPPEQDRQKQQKTIEIVPSGISDNLFFIRHKIWFPYNLKFHFIGLFHFLMKAHIKKIIHQIGRPVDIVWSFDLGNLYPFAFFSSSAYKIFHPVDEPLNAAAINMAKGSDIIFSLTREILEKYRDFPAPKYFINHGVSDEFFQDSDRTRQGSKIRVGLSGNFLRPDIDRRVLLSIIDQNPSLEFHFFGSYRQNHSNIGGTEDETATRFIERLRSLKQVILHGVLEKGQLAAALHGMDCFLICYDVRRDQSRGTNYHKIMEYLSTGKVIVSNNVTTYQDEPDLVRMVESRFDNHALPSLFKKAIETLSVLNSHEKMSRRIEYARANSYKSQISRIERILEEQPAFQ